MEGKCMLKSLLKGGFWLGMMAIGAVLIEMCRNDAME